MSRTYKCTKGANKKLKKDFNDYIYSSDKSDDIDIINGNDEYDSVKHLRTGKNKQSVPRYYRKMLNRSKKAKFEQKLNHYLKNMDYDLEKPILKKDAGYFYF